MCAGIVVAGIVYLLAGFYITAAISARFQELSIGKVNWFYKIVAVFLGIFWILVVAISLVAMLAAQATASESEKKKETK